MIPRSYEREFEPSPTYSFRNAATVTTTSPMAIELDDGVYKKYIPFSNLSIVNNSSEALFLYPNQNANHKILIPAGTIKTIDKSVIPAIRSALIYTQSGNAAANEIEVTIWKEGITQDDLAREEHRRRYKQRGFFLNKW